MSSPSQPPTVSPRGKRRWWRFSLRTLLVFVTLFCVFVGWFVSRLHKAERQRFAVEKLKESSFEVGYDWALNPEGSEDFKPQRPAPTWLRNRLGDDFFDAVVYVRSRSDAGVARSIGDNEFQWIFSLPELRSLHFNESAITQASAARLQELKELENLTVWDSRIDDEWMKGIGACVHLKRLSLLNTPRVTDAGYVYLHSLVDLEDLHSPDGDDSALLAIAQLKHLRFLQLMGHKASDAGVKVLAGLPRLEHLILSSTAITDEGARSLSGLTRLRSLRLNGTAIGDEGIRNLGEHRSIRLLNITWTKVGDSCMKLIGTWDALEVLLLSHTNVGDDGLESIVRLKNLRSLDLSATKVTDKGLKSIAQFSNLEGVFLQGTPVTPAGVQSLHKALPKTSIGYGDSWIEPEK